MQNEEHHPLHAGGPGWRHFFGSRSLLLLLLLPVFHKNWAAVAVPENEELRPSSTALAHAHAHNDYRHDKPLREAIARGFTCVEADVHLVNGELYLGHWFPAISADQTLRRQYLEPLNALLSRQQGKVYPAFDGIFYLMVDIKTDAVKTCTALRNQILQFPLFQNNPHFRVFVSGNRAIDRLLNDPAQVLALDGRLSDLSGSAHASVMPVISDNFRKFFKWRGEGPMPVAERERLSAFAETAHRQGKKLRFWAIPDEPVAWETLLDSGVDLISTDDLKGLEQVLLARLAEAPADTTTPGENTRTGGRQQPFGK